MWVWEWDYPFMADFNTSFPLHFHWVIMSFPSEALIYWSRNRGMRLQYMCIITGQLIKYFCGCLKWFDDHGDHISWWLNRTSNSNYDWRKKINGHNKEEGKETGEGVAKDSPSTIHESHWSVFLLDTSINPKRF